MITTAATGVVFPNLITTPTTTTVSTSAAVVPTSSFRATRERVIFVHFHKAGGTTFCTAFENAGYKLFPCNFNGRPCRTALYKKPIEKSFDLMARNNAQFLAFEWNFFQPQHLANLPPPEVRYASLVICFRDPWKRFLSDMRYHHLQSATMEEANRLLKNPQPAGTAPSKKSLHLHFNYYTRMLSGHAFDYDKPTKSRFADAKRTLNKFDYVLVLEDPRINDVMQRLFGATLLHNNTGVLPPLTKVNEVEDARVFRSKNKMDFELYDMAKVRFEQLCATLELPPTTTDKREL